MIIAINGATVDANGNIIGSAGSGKDAAADYLAKRYRLAKIAFADPFKRFLMEVFEFSEEQLWGSSAKRVEPDARYRRVPLPLGLSAQGRAIQDITDFEDQRALGIADGTFLTPRYALTSLGSGWGRDCYEDVWAKHAARMAQRIVSGGSFQYFPTKGLERVPPGVRHEGAVLSDLRFKNELSAMQAAGAICIRIKRPVKEGLRGAAGEHASEIEQREIPDSEFDMVVQNDSSLEALGRRMEDVVEAASGKL